MRIIKTANKLSTAAGTNTIIVVIFFRTLQNHDALAGTEDYQIPTGLNENEEVWYPTGIRILVALRMQTRSGSESGPSQTHWKWELEKAGREL